MQAAEALQLVVALANLAEAEQLLDMDDQTTDREEFDSRAQDAVNLVTEILSVAVPVARFRCYVTVEKIGQKSKLGLGNYSVSAIEIAAIKNGIVGLSMEPVSVYIQLWEHREEGKFDMLVGYQGPTKTLGFRNFLKDIDRFERDPSTPTNVIEQR